MLIFKSLCGISLFFMFFFLRTCAVREMWSYLAFLCTWIYMCPCFSTLTQESICAHTPVWCGQPRRSCVCITEYYEHKGGVRWRDCVVMATRTEHEMERNVARMDSSPVAPLATFPSAPLFRRGGGGGGGRRPRKRWIIRRSAMWLQLQTFLDVLTL